MRQVPRLESKCYDAFVLDYLVLTGMREVMSQLLALYPSARSRFAPWTKAFHSTLVPRPGRSDRRVAVGFLLLPEEAVTAEEAVRRANERWAPRYILFATTGTTIPRRSRIGDMIVGDSFVDPFLDHSREVRTPEELVQIGACLPDESWRAPLEPIAGMTVRPIRRGALAVADQIPSAAAVRARAERGADAIALNAEAVADAASAGIEVLPVCAIFCDPKREYVRENMARHILASEAVARFANGVIHTTPIRSPRGRCYDALRTHDLVDLVATNLAQNAALDVFLLDVLLDRVLNADDLSLADARRTYHHSLMSHRATDVARCASWLIAREELYDFEWDGVPRLIRGLVAAFGHSLRVEARRVINLWRRLVDANELRAATIYCDMTALIAKPLGTRSYAPLVELHECLIERLVQADSYKPDSLERVVGGLVQILTLPNAPTVAVRDVARRHRAAIETHETGRKLLAMAAS